MQRAQAATPGPVKGMPRISSSSCAVPSSPPGPCRATKATSGRSAAQPLDQVARRRRAAATSWPSRAERVLDPGAGAQRDAALQRAAALQHGDLHPPPSAGLAERQHVRRPRSGSSAASPAPRRAAGRVLAGRASRRARPARRSTLPMRRMPSRISSSSDAGEVEPHRVARRARRRRRPGPGRRRRRRAAPSPAGRWCRCSRAASPR